MALSQEIQQYSQEISAEYKEKKGIYTLSLIVAERKTMLSKQKLTYQAKFRIDETKKLVKFTELLLEIFLWNECGHGFSNSEFSDRKRGPAGIRY